MISQGQNISGYVIEDELGHGGFGRVFLARDSANGSQVAIKFLHPRLVGSESAQQSFLDEMINQARLSANPNIVHVIRSIQHSDRQGKHLGMVMEYVDGDPLDLYVRRNGLLPDYLAVPIFLQVLNGLSFAHNLNMLHRDIKPGNIMIGRNGVVKIMDFGLSKMMESTKSGSSESARAASLNYVAPERLARQRIDARSDIYSLGATFYEALTGVPPYEIEPGNWKQAEERHTSGSFKPIQSYYPEHSEELNNIVSKMLSPELEERYGSCDQAEADLGMILRRLSPPSGLSEEGVRIFYEQHTCLGVSPAIERGTAETYIPLLTISPSPAASGAMSLNKSGPRLQPSTSRLPSNEGTVLHPDEPHHSNQKNNRAIWTYRSLLCVGGMYLCSHVGVLQGVYLVSICMVVAFLLNRLVHRLLPRLLTGKSRACVVAVVVLVLELSILMILRTVRL